MKSCLIGILAPLLLASGPGVAAQSVTLDGRNALVDLRQAAWECVHDAKTNTPVEEIRSRTNWRPIRVGQSWERVGRPELRRGLVWVRTRVAVPASLQGYRLGFFCTAAGGAAEVYLNGRQVGRRVEYFWGHDVPGPFRIELGEALRFGEENELLIRCDPKGAIRSIGLLGMVGLHQSLPYRRTDDGGLVVEGSGNNRFHVLLHHGDAVLAQGEQTEFSGAELAALRIPIYGLREDELISVLPAEGRNVSHLHRVDVTQLHFTADNRPPSVRCDKLPGSVGQYELLVLPLHVTGRYRNPFEPREVEVAADFRTPSGRTETVYGFFAQDYRPVPVGTNQEILLPLAGVGTPWRVHYRPRETGRHTLLLRVRDRQGQARHYAGEFEVLPRSHRGYLRVSQRDPRFFEFDNGESFYGAGPSGWFRQMENWMFGGNTRWIPIEAHRQYYERKGANHSRYEYLARWHFGQLYLKGGFIDNYVTWKLEAAVRSMEANGLYWITYGRPGSGRTYRNSQVGRKADPKPTSPSALCPDIIRQAGLASEEELDFEPGGRIELFHTVSRLADSPAIWVWNCAEEDGGFLPEQLPYHDYIRRLDVYQHPHGIGEGTASLQHGSDVALLPGWYRWSFEQCVTNYSKLAGLPYPVLDVEGGYTEDLVNYAKTLDLTERYYHNHLWLCLFLKMAAGGTCWANNELDAANRLFHAAALHRFLQGEHLTKIRWETGAVEVSAAALRGFALRSPEKTLVWIVNPPSKTAPPPVSGATVHIPVPDEGRYRLELWDTWKGSLVMNREVQTANRRVSCELPELATDLAMKVIPLRP